MVDKKFSILPFVHNIKRCTILILEKKKKETKKKKKLTFNVRKVLLKNIRISIFTLDRFCPNKNSFTSFMREFAIQIRETRNIGYSFKTFRIHNNHGILTL